MHAATHLQPRLFLLARSHPFTPCFSARLDSCMFLYTLCSMYICIYLECCLYTVQPSLNLISQERKKERKKTKVVERSNKGKRRFWRRFVEAYLDRKDENSIDLTVETRQDEGFTRRSHFLRNAFRLTRPSEFPMRCFSLRNWVGLCR